MLPTITIVGFSFAYLITAAVLTETIFRGPASAATPWRPRTTLDFPAIIGVSLLGGFAFLLTNFVTDVAVRPRRPEDPAVVTTTSIEPLHRPARRGRRRRRWTSAVAAADRHRSDWSSSRFWVLVALTVPLVGAVRPARAVGDRLQPPSGGALAGHRRASAATCSPAPCTGPVSRCPSRVVVIVPPCRSARVVGLDRRVLRRLGRRRPHAPRRHHAGLPADPPGDGHHRRARPRHPQRVIAMVDRVVADLRPPAARPGASPSSSATTSSPPWRSGRPRGAILRSTSCRCRSPRCSSTRRWTSGRSCCSPPRSASSASAPAAVAGVGGDDHRGRPVFYQWWIAAAPGIAILTVGWRSTSSATACATPFDVRANGE